MRVVVLGAGLAGLSAAWHLVRAGHRVTVVEREAAVGGMARSWRKGPYTLDLGPHRLHSRDPELARHLFEVLEGRVVTTRRRSRILLRGRHFDYPLRAANVIAKLPPGLLVRAVVDYARARVRDRLGGIDERSFEGWVVRRFGRTLYEEFFGAYTEKAWCMPCSEISSDWAARRSLGATHLAINTGQRDASPRQSLESAIEAGRVLREGMDL
jgi:protoporphyrinogen oxidase